MLNNIYKKSFLLISLVSIFSLSSFNTQPVKADAGVTLGIIGTALGGTALGFGAYNFIQNRRLRRQYEYDRYYDSYDYYYEPAYSRRASYSYYEQPYDPYCEDDYYYY